MANRNTSDSPPDVSDKGDSSETIKFKCGVCRRSMEADIDMMGTIVDCPNCGKKVKVPLHIFSVNPFRRPLRRLIGNVSDIQWQVPYFPQVIEALVLIFVGGITLVLYLTVGIASQIAGILQSLMLDARQEIKTGSLVEKSAYAVAAGIYLLILLPFWLILLPFTLLGWLWKHLGYIGLACLLLAVLFAAVLSCGPKDMRSYIMKLISEQTAPGYSRPADGPLKPEP